MSKTKYPTSEELAAAVEKIAAAVCESLLPKLKVAVPQLVQGFSDEEWAKLKDNEDRRRARNASMATAYYEKKRRIHRDEWGAGRPALPVTVKPSKPPKNRED